MVNSPLDQINTSQAPPGFGMGCLPRTRDVGEAYPAASASGDFVIPRDDWPRIANEDRSSTHLISSILDQGRTDMCASYATAQMAAMMWVKQFGKMASVMFAPCDLYNSITGGRPGGSSIQDNVQLFSDRGCLLADTPRNRLILEVMGLDPNHVMPMNDYRAVAPRNADETRQHFRFDVVLDFSEWDQLISSTYRDMPAVYGRAQHAITIVHGPLRNGVVVAKYVNSWDGWGSGDLQFNYGFGYDTERFVSPGLRTYGGAAAVSMVVTDRTMRLMRHLYTEK